MNKEDLSELLCIDCHHPKNDSDFHLEAPGTNWGAALHNFRAPAEPVHKVSEPCRIGKIPDDVAHMSVPWCATHAQFISVCQKAKSVARKSPESDVLISKELFDLFHEGLMIGYGHGPSKTFRVEISHGKLEKHQRFYELLYRLFNPRPLECPMCGEPKAFTIYPYDPSTGYCSVEDKSWTIKLGPNYARLERICTALNVCEANRGALSTDYLVRKSDWDALVTVVKGESK